MSEQQTMVERMFNEIINQGDLDLADELFAADYVDHGPMGETRGVDALAQLRVRHAEHRPLRRRRGGRALGRPGHVPVPHADRSAAAAPVGIGRQLRLIRRLAVTIEPATNPARPPTMAAGTPSSSTANQAVGTYSRRPMINPTMAPIAPAAAAPATAHRAGSGEPRSHPAIAVTAVVSPTIRSSAAFARLCDGDCGVERAAVTDRGRLA